MTTERFLELIALFHRKAEAHSDFARNWDAGWNAALAALGAQVRLEEAVMAGIKRSGHLATATDADMSEAYADWTSAELSYERD